MCGAAEKYCFCFGGSLRIYTRGAAAAQSEDMKSIALHTGVLYSFQCAETPGI